MNVIRSVRDCGTEVSIEIVAFDLRRKRPALSSRANARDLIFAAIEERRVMSGAICTSATLDISTAAVLDWERCPSSHNAVPRHYSGGRYNHHGANTASLTAGDVMLGIPEVRGHGIGIALTSKIARWLGEWPDADLMRIRTVAKDEEDKENGVRRDKFYSAFGVQFGPKEDNGDAYSLPMKVRDLTVPALKEGAHFTEMTADEGLALVGAARPATILDASSSRQDQVQRFARAAFDASRLRVARKQPCRL